MIARAGQISGGNASGQGRSMRWADLILTGGLFGTVLMLIVPIPPLFLDTLLAMNIGFSLLILLTIVYVKDPPEFSGFPTLLLALTLFRLALNICSTRLILTKGNAGNIIDSFGNFVIQGNYIVGFVVFLILVVINFVVITKGAGRIAEVTARFTLDALPGKQMAIDAELNAGIIDEAVATKRRLKVQKEADFYGAMDGASKFVRGDAVAGILITLVNIIGGFAIGAFQMGFSLAESAQKFTLLSIGDGLVSQIPALVISIAAGILVTRASENSNLGQQIGRQLTRYPQALGIAAGMLAVFGLMPGMPAIPFFGLGGLAGYFAWHLKKHQEDDEEESGTVKAGGKSAAAQQRQGGATPGSPEAENENGPAGGSTEDLRKLASVDVFTIEVGYGLLPLAEKRQGGNDLLSRVTGVRRTIARERGILLPPISVRDNLDLESNAYRFLLRGREIGTGTVHPGRWMAINVSGTTVNLKGVPTKEPVFGLDATWIDESEKKTAELNSYTVVDAASVIITHLSEVLKGTAHHLLSRQDTQALVDHVKESQPALVSELLPDLVNLGVIQRVLQNLLRENVAVVNLPLILETIADYASVSKNPDDLSELVRRRLGMYFVPELEYKPGSLRAVTLDPRLENYLKGRVHRSPGEVGLAIETSVGHHVLQELQTRLAPLMNEGLPAVLVCGAEVRLPLRRFFEPSFPRLNVVAFQEIPSATDIENAGFITAPKQITETTVNAA